MGVRVKVICLTIIFLILLNSLPQKMVKNSFASIQSAQAAGLLTRDVAKKFEGILATGYGFTAVLKSDGTVAGAGSNTYDQINVQQWKDIKQISAGEFHTVGLKEDGTVVAAGRNDSGRTNVQGWKDIVKVSAGYEHTVGLKSDGTVVATGVGTCGRTNVQDWTNIVDISAGFTNTVGLRADGTVVATKSNCNSGFSVAGWTDIVAISSGDDHILGLKKDGTVVATGNYAYGETNVSGWHDIVAIAAGYRSSIGLMSDGTVVYAGDNSYGQTNVGGWNHVVAITAGECVAGGLQSDGSISLTGQLAPDEVANENLEYDPFPPVQKIVKPNDSVTIPIKNNLLFQLQDPTYQLSQNNKILAEGQVEHNSNNEGSISYQVPQNLFGSVDLTFPGSSDVWGNPFYKPAVFKVIPLKSITSSEAEVNSGDKVTLTVTFYQPVNPGFTLSLNGAINMDATSMTEVAGSNGTKYILQYTVPNGYTDGPVNATLTNVQTLDGDQYSSYTDNNVFTKMNPPAPVSSLTASASTGKIGDIMTITADFSESVQPGVKLSLDGGAKVNEAAMTQVPGSNGREYTLQYTVPEGQSGKVNAHLTGVVDTNNHLCQEYTSNNLFQTDGIRPSLTSLTASSGTAKLSDQVMITANFSEPVKGNVNLTLSGGTTTKTVVMTEVPDSNGVEYTYEYTVGSFDSGMVIGTISDAEDLAGNQSNQYQQNLFQADGILPQVVFIGTDQKAYGTGDYAHITVQFSEPLQSTVKMMFTGGIDNEEYTMSQVADGSGKNYELYYEIKDGQHGNVNVQLLDIEDLAGNVTTFNQDKLFYILDPSNANLAGLTLADGTTNYSVTPGFDPAINAYSVEVPSTVTSLTVHAQAEDPETTVSVSGNDHLTLGDNQIQVTAVSKDGTTKTYTITVKVKDVEKPIISGADDKSIKVGQAFNALDGVTAADNVDGDVTSALQFNGTVDNTKPNVYTLNYSVSDKTGNVATVVRKITVIDDQAPTINGAGDQSIFINSSFDPFAGVTAKDNVDGNLTGSITISGSVNTKAAGAYTLTYDVKDSSGNKTTVTRKITVIDNNPAAPANVKAVSGSYNTVNFSWTPVSGVTGYEVYRSSSSTGAFVKLAAVTGGSYSNTSLNTGTTYYYKVRAYKTGNSTLYSNFSAAVSARPVPAAPASVKALSGSYNSIVTSWAAVSGANGYLVYRATSITGAYSLVGTAVSTSFTNTGLAANQTYYYKIIAYRMVGSTKVTGNYSAVVSAKPIPAVPSSVKAVSASYNSVRTSWAAVSGASGYLVYRSTSSTGAYTLVGTTTSTSYTNTGLTTNQPYYYKIKAFRVVGSTKVYSNDSAVVSARPIPSTPANLKVTRLSSTSIKLSWASVLGASGYEIYKAPSSSGTYSLLKSTTSSSFSNGGLTRGRTYYYKIRAYRTVGRTKVFSGWSTIVGVKM